MVFLKRASGVVRATCARHVMLIVGSSCPVRALIPAISSLDKQVSTSHRWGWFVHRRL